LVGAIERAAPGGPDAVGRSPADRKVEERLVGAWRELKGQSEPAAAPRQDRPLRVPLIVLGVSYLTLVIWSLPLS
jgi:hypothetical protein